MIKYTNCDIPAVLFFDELMHGNTSVLGDGSKDELEEVYFKILEEYVDLSKNNKIKKWYNDIERASNIKRAISDVYVIVANICMFYGTKYITDYTKIINSLEYPTLNFDPEKDLLAELERINYSVIGSLKNELQMIDNEKNTEVKKAQKNFIKNIVSIQNSLGYSIEENVTLRKYIYLEQSVRDMIKSK